MFTLTALMYVLGQTAVACMAAATVLEAGKKRYDLFGMVVVAFTACLGGGSVRDVLLDRPVFWVVDQTYLLTTLLAALVTFVVARVVTLPRRFFLLPDALALALFTVSGTRAALSMGAPWLVASFMGLLTGVMGGVLRDVLCNEEPLVFQGTLYATPAWLGALLFIAMTSMGISLNISAVSAGGLIFLVRLIAIRYAIGLPVYREKGA